MTTHVTPVAQLLLPARAAAEMCGTSERTWRTWDAAGRIPRAINVGRAKFWRTRELETWIASGCPSRNNWDADSKGRMS